MSRVGYIALSFIVAVLVSILTKPAKAHDEKHLSDWIGNSGSRNPVTGEHCCGVNDCLIVPADDVLFDGASNSWIWRGIERIPAQETLRSRDGHFWRCHQPNGKRRCFFVPPGVS